MEKTILITGITGHLGHAIVNQLLNKGYNIRGLVYYGEKPDKEWLDKKNKMQFFEGDVSDSLSLVPLFDGLEGQDVYLIHSASLIDIQHRKITPRLIKINVDGTKNVLEAAKKAHVKRTIYISSVDSFKANSIVANESSPYTDDPKSGGYALSKALANQECIKARENGMDIVIIYPTALIGPYDKGNNHIVQLMRDFLNGGIPGIIKGGYDIADVRDLAIGIEKALFLDNAGTSYILSGHVVSLKELLKITENVYGSHRRIIVFPTWLAHIGVPFVKAYCSIKKKRPLYTSFALSVIKHANTFDNTKARTELSYVPRPIEETIADTVHYLDSFGLIKTKK